MNIEELKDKIREICPDMLTHENFMHVAELLFCKDISNDGTILSNEEIKSMNDLSSRLHSATVAQLIQYLQDNFDLDDKICYMDCVEGLKNDCTYVQKSQIGQNFFYYVKDLKKNNRFYDDELPYVDDNDIIVV